MNYSTVLFDLDGTLTDPREGITRCVQFALARLGIDEPDRQRLEHFIGPPLLQTFMQAYDLDQATAWKAVTAYRERFSEVGLYENRLFPGIPELLEQLRGQGRCLVMATSKPTVYAKRIAEHFGFAGQFDAIHGSELDGTRTNKVELIRHLLAVQGIAAGQALMIGDREHDLIGARQNGLDSAAVAYGFGSPAELQAQAPTYYFESVAALSEAFACST